MLAPYGITLFDRCDTCTLRKKHFFCDLSVSAVQRLSEITAAAVYPKGAILFVEGQKTRGVFILCSGRAKLSSCSRDGRTVITKLSESGDILGLNPVMSNRPYEVTAEMVAPGQVNFIPQGSFLALLKDYGDVAYRVAQQLSVNYFNAFDKIRALGLSASAAEKLAGLLLQWTGDRPEGDSVRMTLTHEEIAESIGTTRETVTRLLAEFRKKQFLKMRGSDLIVCNRPALGQLIRY